MSFDNLKEIKEINDTFKEKKFELTRFPILPS